jgi:hypothetical protein
VADHLDTIEAETGTRDFAHLVRLFYQSLIAEGFGKREAMTITLAWMRAMLPNG